MKTFKRILYWVVQCTWGLLESLIGFIVALVLLCLKNKPQRIGHTFYFRVKYGAPHWGGVSLGPVIIISEECSEHTLKHEYGHTIQNMIFGPLMLFIVAIPSMARYWLRDFFRNEKHSLYSVIEITLIAICIILFGISINCITSGILIGLFWFTLIVATYLSAITAFIAIEYYRYKRKGLGTYDGIWFERTASRLGYKLIK